MIGVIVVLVSNRFFLSLEILILIVLVIMGICIIHRIRRRSRQIFNIMSTEAAKKEFENMVKLSRFQLVDTLIMSLDVVFTASSSIYTFLLKEVQAIKVVNLSNPCALDARLGLLKCQTISAVIGTVYFALYAISHAEIFFIYLIFFKKFQRAFVRGFKKCCGKRRK